MKALANDAALYDIADTLAMPIYFDSNGLPTADHSRQLVIGPWLLNTYLKLTPDTMERYTQGVFVKIRKHLWTYLYSDPLLHRLYCVVFDATLVGLKTMEVKNFRTGHAADTIEKLRPGIKACFRFVQEVWVPCEVDHLEFGQQFQSSSGTGTSAVQ